MRRLPSQLRSDSGASSVEYALIAVAIAAAIVLVVFTLGGYTHNLYQNTSDCIAAGSASTC